MFITKYCQQEVVMLSYLSTLIVWIIIKTKYIKVFGQPLIVLYREVNYFEKITTYSNYTIKKYIHLILLSEIR